MPSPIVKSSRVATSSEVVGAEVPWIRPFDGGATILLDVTAREFARYASTTLARLGRNGLLSDATRSELAALETRIAAALNGARRYDSWLPAREWFSIVTALDKADRRLTSAVENKALTENQASEIRQQLKTDVGRRNVWDRRLPDIIEIRAREQRLHELGVLGPEERIDLSALLRAKGLAEAAMLSRTIATVTYTLEKLPAGKATPFLEEKKRIEDPIKRLLALRSSLNLEEVQENFAPEYDRSLSRVMLQVLSSGGTSATENERTQVEIIGALPMYSEIVAVTPPDVAVDLKVYDGRKVSVVTARGVTHEYAQDSFEGNGGRALMPGLLGASKMIREKQLSQFISQTSPVIGSILANQGIEVHESQTYFEGGNMWVSRDREGRKVLLVGSNSFLRSQAGSKELGREVPTESQYKAILRKETGADDVIILGRRDSGSNEFLGQLPEFYHLDLFLLPLADGKLAITDPKGAITESCV